MKNKIKLLLFILMNFVIFKVNATGKLQQALSLYKKKDLNISLVLEAHSALIEAKKYLLNKQEANGSWNCSVFVTSLSCLAILNKEKKANIKVNNSLEKGLKFIRLFIHNNGGIYDANTSEHHLLSTATALILLTQNKDIRDENVIKKAREFLIYKQNKEIESIKLHKLSINNKIGLFQRVLMMQAIMFSTKADNKSRNITKKILNKMNVFIPKDNNTFSIIPLKLSAMIYSGTQDNNSIGIMHTRLKEYFDVANFSKLQTPYKFIFNTSNALLVYENYLNDKVIENWKNIILLYILNTKKQNGEWYSNLSTQTAEESSAFAILAIRLISENFLFELINE